MQPYYKPDDEGTIHIFLKNLHSQAVEIQGGFINDIPLSDQKVFLWHRISPNPIPPMEVGELVVRLLKDLKSLSQSEEAKLRLITDKDSELSAEIPLTNHPFNFTFIGFSDALDKIYLYMKNYGQRTLSIDKVFLSTKDVTRKCYIPERKILQNEKKLIVVKLYKPLVRGKHITVKVTTQEGGIAQSRVRASSHFPIAVEYYHESSYTKLFTDTSSYNDNLGCHIIDCPMHIGDDHSIKAVRSKTERIRERMDEMEKKHPLLPGYIHVCRDNIHNGCAFFGQITDLIRINPSIGLLPSFLGLPWFRRYIPSETEENPVQYLTALAKEGSEPQAFHTVISATSNNKELNIDATPELERFMVYSAVSRASKGIFYRDFGHSLKDKPSLQQEIKRINGELQVLKRFLKIGELMPMAECTNPNVEPNTILAGDKAVILILINQKPTEQEKTGDEVRRFFSPKMHFEVAIHIPKWMKIKDVYEVGGDFGRLKYIRQGNTFTIKIDRLDFVRQIVFTTNPDDYNHDQDNDGISDIEEIVFHGTHPAIRQ